MRLRVDKLVKGNQAMYGLMWTSDNVQVAKLMKGNTYSVDL